MIAQISAEALFRLPTIACLAWVFVLGISIGSFLNVLIARLPYEKAIAWPGSRCFKCLQPIRFWDNLPILGYLRLRGRCRSCKASFSSRYLWIELLTGLLFVGLFLWEIVWNKQEIPGLRGGFVLGLPPLHAWLYAAAHAYLLAMLLASAVIDLDYRIIPTQITYSGTLVGLVVSTLMPWPWPSDLHTVPLLADWSLPQVQGTIPTGVALWPVWTPPSWAPAGSPQLGFLTGLAGAAAGMATIRALKFVFEYGFGQEALGLGDADLLMMAGAFLGWQPIMLAVPLGAFVTLSVLPFVYVVFKLRRRPFPNHVPFGPGLVGGVLLCWLCWPFFGELVRTLFFQPVLLGFGAFAMLGLLMIAGRLLRRG